MMTAAPAHVIRHEAARDKKCLFTLYLDFFQAVRNSGCWVPWMDGCTGTWPYQGPLSKAPSPEHHEAVPNGHPSATASQVKSPHRGTHMDWSQCSSLCNKKHAYEVRTRRFISVQKVHVEGKVHFEASFSPCHVVLVCLSKGFAAKTELDNCAYRQQSSE